MKRFSSKFQLSIAASFVICHTFIASYALAVRIDVSNSPNNDLQLTLNAIESAQQSLYINAYEFTSTEIANAVLKKIQQGVKVEILAEGQPVGGIGLAGKKIRADVVRAMEQATTPAHYYVMSSEDVMDGTHERRFRFDHAKYMISDEQTVLIGSENYSPTGNPVPGHKGTRGWQTLIHDQNLAGEFKKMFLQDSDPSFEDIQQLVKSKWSGPIPFFAHPQHWLSDLNAIDLTRFDSGIDGPKTFNAEAYTRVTSPTTSLSGMLTLLRSAKSKLDLELMSFSYRWGNTGNVSPLFQAVVDAARRGVQVRVLLNDGSVFINSHGNADNFIAKKQGNEITRDEFLKIARKEGLKLAVEIADVEAMGVKYVHNKGALVDGDKTFISSINWNRNSVENNRETAVVIASRQVYDYYHTLFEDDWKKTVRQ